jgi:glycosyltransferase involved in cell wall biosynthesis
MPTRKKHIIWVLANCNRAPYFIWFAREAAKHNDFQLSFVALYPSRPELVNELNALGFECHWIPYNSGSRKQQLVKAFIALRRYFKKTKPDVVHTHLFDDSLCGILAAKYAQVPMRVVTKGDASYHHYHVPHWTRFDKMINEAANDIIALSEESKAFILNTERAPIDKVHLLHHGLAIDEVTNTDVSTIEAMRKRWNLTGKHVVGVVSRMVKWKGYDLLLDIASETIKKDPNVHFLFCGDGPEKEHVMRRIAEMRLSSNVSLTGPIPVTDMPSFFRCLNVFLHGAKMEPFGLVIAEAMLNGVPVVSTPTGAAGDAIISGKHGYICACGNTSEMSESILKLRNSELASELGKNAKEQATILFSSSTNYKNLLQLYTKSYRQ